MRNKDIEFNGIPLHVIYKYSPAEEAIPYDKNMEGYPGSDEDYKIVSITYNFQEVLDIYSSLGCLEEIEELLK